MTPLRLGVWVALALVQLAIPAWMIVGEERVLRDGRQVKLMTRPIDPADVFRGRYVALAFTADRVPRELVRADFDYADVAYVELRQNADGFAEVVALHKDKPAGELVIKGTVNFLSPETVGVELPFDRYYMDENLAPRADAVALAGSAAPPESWATVRILGGRAVLEELYMDGKPAPEYLRAWEQPQQQPAP